MFRDTLVGGFQRALALWLALPLYLAGLLLGLLQAWPALGANGAGPLLNDVAAGQGDGLLLFVLADPAATAPFALVWVVAALAVALIYGLAYNFFGGGILGAWAGTPFWAGCRRYFLSFTILGVLLVLMAVAVIVLASLVGAVAGFTTALVVAVVLLQLVGLWGEYSRAAAVAAGRAEPIFALGAGARAIARRPLAALALALLGLLLHGGIAALYSAIGPRVGWWAPLVQQAAAFAWVWAKLLRLGWAAALVEQGQGYDTLVPTQRPAL
jgi:hypothetical protein